MTSTLQWWISLKVLDLNRPIREADMVITSQPAAGNAANDPVTLPAYMALAKDLMAGG